MSEFSELRGLLDALDTKRSPITEAIFPVAARQMQELQGRLDKSWARAYGEFVGTRHAAYDIAKTFNINTMVSRGTKVRKDLSDQPDESLVRTIDRVARSFRKDFQEEIVKSAGDIRATARRLSEVADSAPDLNNPELRSAASAFIAEYLPFRSAIGDHFYRSVTAIGKRVDEILIRFGMSPSEKENKTRDTYKGIPLGSVDEVSDSARKLVDHLDLFVHLAEPTIEHIEKIADLADETAKDIPAATPAEIPADEAPVAATSSEESDYVLAPAPIKPPEPKRTRKLHSGFGHAWEDDPEFTIDT